MHLIDCQSPGKNYHIPSYTDSGLVRGCALTAWSNRLFTFIWRYMLAFCRILCYPITTGEQSIAVKIFF